MKPDERYAPFSISDDAHWEVLHVLHTCSLLQAGARDEQHVGFLKELVVPITQADVSQVLKRSIFLILKKCSVEQNYVTET